MPTHEAIVDNLIPKQVEKPIPVRTVSTKHIKPAPIEIAGQPLTNNNPAAESAPKTEESVRLSPQLTALARKEQAYRQKEQALKQREKELEAKLQEAEKFQALKEKFGSKDFSEAEALGLSYEDYTKYVLEKQGGENPQDLVNKKLEAEIEAIKKRDEESAATRYEETVAEYKKEIAKAVGENPEFSSVKELNKEDAVLQLILDAFEEDDEELSVADACKQIEDYLVDFGKKFTSLPKLKPKEEPVPEKVLPRPNLGKTLTNNMTASSDKQPQKSLQHLSEAERYAEARRRVLERREKGK